MHGKNMKKFMDAINLLSQPCGTTVTELGNRLGIDKRQVYRVIETIQDSFKFVILKDKAVIGGGVRYYLDKEQFKRLSDMRVADLNLTTAEIVALYFLKGHAKLYRGTGIEAEIERAFAKLHTFVPAEFGKRLEKVKTIFLPATKFAKDYSDKEAIIEALTDATLGQHTCLVEYHSFTDDEIKKYRIDPLHFFERNGGLYLFVRATRFGDIRLLAVERIASITVTDDVFDYPADFDPDSLLEGAFGIVYDDPVEVKIRISVDQARYIQERCWAKNQKITECEDGSVVLEMETSGWWDVKRWVLSFGTEAELLEPAGLRKEIAEELQSAASRYCQIER